MSDYTRIAEAIEYIVSQVDSQPSLEQIAGQVNMSPFHFQRMFSRWAGVSPKRFLQVLTLNRAKNLLVNSRSILDTAHSVGLSSASRLYDHFVKIEAIMPGEYKNGGKGLTLQYGVHKTPFGEAFLVSSHRGICLFGFVDFQADYVREIENRWPLANYNEDKKLTGALVQRIFSNNSQGGPLSLHISGTNFQVQVWQALLRIPPARVVSYSQVAQHLCRPQSARAVGTAIGQNPVAFLIPCHRVIRQTGELGGYHWGETRLHAIHAWETARSTME